MTWSQRIADWLTNETNKRQRVALWCGAAAIALLLLFPPSSRFSRDGVSYRGFQFVFSQEIEASPDPWRIVLGALAIVWVLAMALVALRTRSEGAHDPPAED